jgi:hypothetical protein
MTKSRSWVGLEAVRAMARFRNVGGSILACRPDMFVRSPNRARPRAVIASIFSECVSDDSENAIFSLR